MVLKILRRRNQEFADLASSYQVSFRMNAQMQAASLPIGNPLLDGAKLVRSARAVIATEARAIEVLHDRIDGRFLRACQLMFECSGRVVVSGMGKSGHIARKIAATLASTGTPSFFVHPGEASHGDLGMTAIVDGENRLLGVFTDGDLRRAVDNDDIDLRATQVTQLMTAQPKTIVADKLAVEAARLMEAHKIHALLVVDEANHVVGALNIHDLLRARVV
jgi:CBS domain-containing protein